MLFIVVLQTVLIVMLIGLFFYKTFLAKEKSQNSAEKVNRGGDGVTTRNYIGANYRRTFRVGVDKKNCLVKFVEFENNKFNKLKDREFECYIENISIGGLKLVCQYDIPIKQSIIIKITFSLKEQEFCLTGKIVRKENYQHNQLVSYGVQFQEMSMDEERKLTKVLNQIVVETKQRQSV